MKERKLKKTVRVTVKMDEKMHAQLKRKAKNKSVTVSTYIRSLIEKENKTSGDCYGCLGELEKTLYESDSRTSVIEFIKKKYRSLGGDF